MLVTITARKRGGILPDVCQPSLYTQAWDQLWIPPPLDFTNGLLFQAITAQGFFYIPAMHQHLLSEDGPPQLVRLFKVLPPPSSPSSQVMGVRLAQILVGIH